MGVYIKRNDGFTLVEILFAFLIVSIAMLGLAKMQSVGLRSNAGSQLRVQASMLANDLAERMRANKASAMNGAYVGTYAAGSCATAPSKMCASIPSNRSPADCTGDEMAGYDRYEWHCRLIDALPNGSAQVSLTGGAYSISVSWSNVGSSGSVSNNNISHMVFP